jgi:SAM-dependent methyltransferase
MVTRYRHPVPVKRVLRVARYGGRRLVCPCCGGHARKLMPYGAPRRPNRACPYCGSLQRHRVLALYLRRVLAIDTTPSRILHIAPERAVMPVLRGSPSRVYATVDLSAPNAAIRAELGRLPFRDGAFDVVVCSHVLEHIDDDRAAMQELARVVASSGQVLVMVPVDRSLSATFEDPTIVTREARQQAYGHPEHVRYYGPDVADRLRTAGFAVDEVDMTDVLTADEAARAVVGRGEIVYVCRA